MSTNMGCTPIPINKKIFPAVFLGLALIFAGCAGKGVQITEEEEIVFRSPDYPRIEIRIARDIRYMKGDADPAGENPAPGGSRHDKKNLTSKRYTFLNPYDPELGCIKMVNIEIKTFEADDGQRVLPDFKVFPGVIRYGKTRFNNTDYQYGIALNPFFTASIKNDWLKVAATQPGGPIKMISKIYSRVFGDDNSGIVTISYSESLPEDLDWHPSNPMTAKRRQFLDGFLKRCDRNLVIMD